MQLELVILVDLLCLVISKDTWKAEHLPNPQQQTWGCGRGGQASWICDPTNVLTQEQADELDYEIERQVVKCPCSSCDTPYPMAIALIPRVQSHTGEFPDTKEEKRQALDAFARILRDVTWNFGDCSDDIIILLSTDNREFFTSLGYRAKDVLVKDCVEAVRNETEAYLQNGTYYQALKHMVKQYRAVLAHEKVCNVPQLASLPFPIWIFFIICISPLILFVALRYTVIAACGIDLLFCCPKPGTLTPCAYREKRRRELERGINEEACSGEDTEPT